MSVLTRIFLAYLVVVVLVALFGVLMFTYVSDTLEDNLYDNLSATSARMSQQLDNLIRPMEYTSLHLLSNRSFYTAVEDLAGIDRSNPNNLMLINRAENEIYSQMMSYSLYKYFYRVSVFNPKKDFFSSNFLTEIPRGGYWSVIDSLEWLELLRANSGHIVIMPPYDDPWDVGDPERVFSVSREIRGGPDLGYIEVQQKYSSIEEVFSLGSSAGTSVCAVTREGGVFYDGGYSGPRLEYYISLAGTAPEVSEPLANPVTGSEEVFAGYTSDYTGVSILIIQDHRLLRAPLTRLRTQILSLYMVLAGVSCAFFAIQTRSLVAPLRQLKREMEVTRLENLPVNGTLETSNNEITSLANAFYDLKERLGELIEQELTLRSLHMQANFDALQAQINPHFIYNTLGLISNRAAVQGDDGTSRICGAIASMLRYSVNTKTRLAALSEELCHLEDYIFLMKERFEHRLEVKIDVAPEILETQLPKMTLQPLVENAVSHGFENVEGTMRIEITGGLEEGGWRVEIADNGQGFAEEALEKIRARFREFDQNRGGARQSGMELGGLGILNIYARMRLYSPEGEAFFSIQNRPEGGASVIIGGNMNPQAAMEKKEGAE